MRIARLEELEERIAPAYQLDAGAAPLEFVDADGDTVTVEYTGPAGSYVTITDATGDDFTGDSVTLGTITFTGSDLTSILRIVEWGGGDGQFDLEGISAPGQDVGFIALGESPEISPAGAIHAQPGFEINIGASLGGVFWSGEFDSRGGANTIQAGGNIGSVYIGSLILDADGVANVIAGPGGSGNIGFFYSDYTRNSDGSGFELLESYGSPITIQDDAGNGTTGSLIFAIAGHSEDTYLAIEAIPVVGGGSCISYMFCGVYNTHLAVASKGTGGDIAYMEISSGFDEMFGNPLSAGVFITGKGPVDILEAHADDNLGSFVNKTPGGDLGYLGSDGSIGFVTLDKAAAIGAAWSGPASLTPETVLVAEMSSVWWGGISAGDFILRINAGAIVDAEISAYILDSIKVSQIVDSNIWAGDGIGLLSAGTIEGSNIIVDPGVIVTVSVGQGGIHDSYIAASAGVLTVASKGAITESYIHAFVTYEDEPGTLYGGGPVGVVTAASIQGGEIASLTAIGKVAVKGAIDGTFIYTNFMDGSGGPIGLVSAGGILHDATITALTGIDSIKIGAGGMADGVLIESYGDINSVSVLGSVADSDIHAYGTVASVKIGGSTNNMAIEGLAGVGSVAVKGSIVTSTIATWASDWQIGGDTAGIAKVTAGEISDSLIQAAGNIGSVTARGLITSSSINSVTEDGFGVGDPAGGGTIGAVTARGLVDSGLNAFAGITSVSLGANGIDSGSSVAIYDGNLGGLKTAGLIYGEISVAGGLTGSILSAGPNALLDAGTYYFLDKGGVQTGGTLTVGGSLSTRSIVS